MKYLLRILCAIIIYPLCIAYCAVLIIIANIGLIVWYFDTKHLFWFDNYYFYIRRNAGWFEPYEKKDVGVCIKSVIYDEYYKTPYDMIMGNLTREYK